MPCCPPELLICGLFEVGCNLVQEEIIRLNTATPYCIRLSHEEFEGGELQVIESVFRQIYVAANGPFGMALFLHRSPGESGCRLYLSAASMPHAAALVRAYGACPVEGPLPERMSLRVGDAVLASGYTREF